MSYTLSALAILSADDTVPMWNPFQSHPRGALALMQALSRAAADCARQAKNIDSSGHYKRASRNVEEPLTMQQLCMEGDLLVTLLNKAVIILTIMDNFASGHLRLAQV